MTESLDFTRAIVVTPESLSGQEQKAVGMLIDEVAARSRIRWPVRHDWPADPAPVVAVGPAASIVAGPFAPKRVVTVRSGPVRAKVVDGIALLDLRSAGERTAKGTPHQSILLEGRRSQR